MVFAIIGNIILYFFIQFLRLRYLTQKLGIGFINPFTILFVCQLPIELMKLFGGPVFLVEEGLLNPFFNFAVLMTSLQLLCDFLLLRLSFSISKKLKIRIEIFEFKVRVNKMLRSSVLFYFVFFICFLLLANNSFGVLNWIRDPRTGYQLHRTGAGQFWLFAISFLSLSFSLFLIFQRSYLKILLCMPIFLWSAFLLGSKGIILQFFIFILIVLLLRKFKYLKIVGLIGVPLAFGLAIFNFFSTLKSSNGLASIFEYFDYYYNSTLYYTAYFKGNINLFKGDIFLTDFWGLVPRSLVPDKPHVYGILLVNEFFYPGAAEATNTPAFGGPIAAFADFGIFGVIFLSCFNVINFVSYLFLYQLVANYNYEKIRSNSAVLILFIVFLGPFFLFSLTFPLNLIFLFVVSVLLGFINRLVFK